MDNTFSGEVLTVEELMELLYIGKNRAYELVRSGQIRAFRIGKTWRIPKEAVSEFIMSRTRRH